MNKLLLIALIIFPLTIQAQKKGGYLFSVQPTVGYEFNMLKSPTSYQGSNQDLLGRDSLWKNAPFIGVQSRYLAYSKKKMHTVDLRGVYNRALFTSGMNVDAGELSFATNYRYRNLKKVTNQTFLEFRNFRRTGVDQRSMIGVPLSYNRFTISNELDLKTGKRSHLILKPFSIHKYYQRDGFEAFNYMDNGMNVTFQNGNKMKKKVGYGFDVGFHQRNYRIERVSDATVINPDEEFDPELEASGSQNRLWRYYEAGYGMRFPISKKLKVTTHLGYTLRRDVSQERLGFHQLKLQTGINYKAGKWRINVLASTSRRAYTELSFEIPGAIEPEFEDFEESEEFEGEEKEEFETEALLRYQYFSYVGNLKYNINDRLALTFRTTGRARLSNANFESRRSMRSYFTTSFIGGIQWTFKGDLSPGKSSRSRGRL